MYVTSRTLRFAAFASLASLVSLASLAACDADLAAPDDAVTHFSASLYGNKDYLWTGNPALIPVCWENASSNTIYAPTFTVPESTSREWVRNAVEGQWSRYGRLSFTTWDACTPGKPGVHIQIVQSGGSSAPGGSTLNGVTSGVKLNLYYADRSDCQASQASLQRCVQAVALHEFGHVLGFYHEEERPDYASNATGACARQSWPNANPQYYGAFDVDSVMSYCGQPANDISTWKTELSPGDIAAIQKAYGRRVAGQMVSVRSADMLSDNNAPDARAFLWDGDEANGQRWSYDFASQSFRNLRSTAAESFCLDAAASGASLATAHCAPGAASQRFPLSDVHVRGWGGLCLDVPGGNTANYTALQMWKCGALGGANQKFRVDTSRRIAFAGTNKCLTWSAVQGASIFLHDCGGAYAAQQAFGFAVDGSLTTSGGRCVDVEAWTSGQYLAGQGLPRSGARVQTYSCLADQTNQKWNLSGAFRSQGGACLAVSGGGYGNGPLVLLSGCNGSAAQEWDYYWK
jgi:hypothetical protein